MKKINWLIWVLAVMVTISLIFNIKNQFLTLKMAGDENVTLNKEIKQLDESNKDLIKQINYSTSSAFVDQKAREYFGLGNGSDAWLILPPEKKIELDLNPTEIKETTKFRQWLNLFTR